MSLEIIPVRMLKQTAGVEDGQEGLEGQANRGHTKTACLMKVQDVPKQGGPGLTWQVQETCELSEKNRLLHGNGTDRM